MIFFKQIYPQFVFKAEPESIKFCLFRSHVYRYIITNIQHESFKCCIAAELLLEWTESVDRSNG